MGTFTLDPPKSMTGVDNKDDKAVSTALEVINRNWTTKNERDRINRDIQNLFEQGFEVRSPNGPRKINSKKLYQAVWRMASRMKPLDFTMHGTGRGQAIERVVADGVATVMTEGGYAESLRNKGGAFYNLLMWGDGFLYAGANPKAGPPIVFMPVSNTNIYVDNFATAIRSQGWGRDASKLVAIFSYSWPEFVAMYPHMKNKVEMGRIPREFVGNEIERNKDYQYNLEDEIIEVAHSYDTNYPNYTIFAGPSCSIVEKHEKEDNPFMLNKEPYIPILQYMCWPSSEGFYNYGIGNMIYDLAILSRRLLNMEMAHIEDNTYPIELVNVPQGEASKFFNKLSLAHEMRANGKKGFVAMEYDPTSPQTVNSQTLLTQSLVNEWQLAYDTLDREIKRMGIPLDEIDRQGNITATQILAEEENANALVKQIMEYNASESKFAVELTIDMIKEYVTKKDKTPINLSTSIRLDSGQELVPEGVTMGMVSDELNKNNYFVRINARSGAIPSNVLRSAQVSRGLQVAAPGTVAQKKLLDQYAQLHDLDIPGEDFVTPFGQGQKVPEDALEAEPSDTDRLTINPQKATQDAVL